MKVIDKAQIRALLLNKRRSLTPEDHACLSKRIVEKLKGLQSLLQAKKPVLFCPFDNEPDITPLFSYVMNKTGSLILPKVKGDSLVLYSIQEINDLEVGSFCIMEPTNGEQIDPKDVDFILVPGVAFDKKGYRLGFGKGYYDRLLPKTEAFKVGVCYSFQVLKTLPIDPWDVPMDLVVTEDFVIEGGRKI